MIRKIFSIHDSCAQMYFPPFYMHNENMAIRDFSNTVNNPETQFHENPADYTLFLIGIFDDETGEIVHNPPKSLGNATAFLSHSEPPNVQIGNVAQLQPDPEGQHTA